MKKVFLVVCTAIALYGCGAKKGLINGVTPVIKTQIDLVNIVDDKVMVTIDPDKFTSDQVSFFIPKTVPGTYSNDNYGKYIDDFKALDYNGKAITFNKTDDNTWVISDGKTLDKIVYYVNDTYDSESEIEDPVFSPSGTNILKGKNFMLNLHGFVGYFDNLKEIPYEITITKPENLTSTTSLKQKAVATPNSTTEVFEASRYFEVIDNPILYAKADKETFTLNGITVTLSVYSPSGVYSALSLRPQMEEMVKAQKTFLGEIDGTKEYNILLYLSTLDKDAGGFGALEHHTSTVVVLPEAMPKPALDEAMKDVVSHEFFHIVTPLNVHSEEVQYFDFNDPKMSQHLWMYEGTTEYFANLFQIQQGLIDEAAFYERLMDKIGNSKSYDDTMSFTKMSKNILEEPYKANYANVYEKGTLINMALDITLRELSNGEYGVLWLMKELSKKYGKDIPFKDEALFTEIIAMTYPEIGEFFTTHVIGTTPIDYSSYFAKAGLALQDKELETGYFLNGETPFIDVNQEQQIYVRNGITHNSFFNNLGLKSGDIIKTINDTAITLESIRGIIQQSFTWTPETAVKITVDRNGEEVTLEGTAGKPVIIKNALFPIEDATQKQEDTRASWLKG